jgi:PPOX class probable F420-dependent enzyme
VADPRAERPYMPGYGVPGPGEDDGLLSWSWAEQKFAASRNYWVVTTRPDGRPHAVPVWGVWDGERAWFSSGGRSRKVRNLRADPRCLLAADSTQEPIVLEGTGELVTDTEELTGYLKRLNGKYGTDYDMNMIDPAVQATFRVTPTSVFAMREEEFSESPTRWIFGG